MNTVVFSAVQVPKHHQPLVNWKLNSKMRERDAKQSEFQLAVYWQVFFLDINTVEWRG
jgi:hypothetical protein